MTYAIFFAGVGAVVIGSLLTVILTFGFQKKILKQQLDFQQKQAEADAMLRKQIHDEQINVIKELHKMLNTRLGSKTVYPNSGNLQALAILFAEHFTSHEPIGKPVNIPIIKQMNNTSKIQIDTSQQVATGIAKLVGRFAVVA